MGVDLVDLILRRKLLRVCLSDFCRVKASLNGRGVNVSKANANPASDAGKDLHGDEVLDFGAHSLQVAATVRDVANEFLRNTDLPVTLEHTHEGRGHILAPGGSVVAVDTYEAKTDEIWLRRIRHTSQSSGLMKWYRTAKIDRVSRVIHKSYEREPTKSHGALGERTHPSSW